MSLLPSACTIAGSDSGGGAGIQADLKAFALHGVHGASVLTALTAQNTTGVQAVAPVDLGTVAAQFDSVFDDLDVRAAKTGMLGDPELIRLVAARLEGRRPRWLVVDPVMVATSGDRLLPEASCETLAGELLPLADLVTPNLGEAGVLLGRPVGAQRDDRAGAAAELARRWRTAVLVKGGHADGADCLAAADGTVRWFDGERIETRHTHGTGCLLSAAIAARLVRGDELAAAVAGAKGWLADGLARGEAVGAGSGPPRPRRG